MELIEDTVTLVLLEAVRVRLTPAVVFRVGEAVLMKLVAATTSVGVTKVADEVIGKGEVVSAVVIGVDVSASEVLVEATSPPEETGSIVVGVTNVV